MSAPYEVVEHIDGPSLRDLVLDANDKDTLRNLVEAIGRALDGFARIGLRHRDLRPEVIQLRDPNGANLVVAGFGAARLSEFDLDMVSPGETTRYMAPEAVLGGVAPASDWWSLGIVLLEKLTGGACFEGIDERAFLIHTLTQGVPLPESLDPELALLLRGLLARDRAKRWQWQEVRAWLDGAPVEAPQDASVPPEQTGPAITLGGTELRSPARYALAAAEAANWDEALDHLARGRLAVWAEEIGLDPKRLAVLRGLLLRELDDDIRLGHRPQGPQPRFAARDPRQHRHPRLAHAEPGGRLCPHLGRGPRRAGAAGDRDLAQPAEAPRGDRAQTRRTPRDRAQRGRPAPLSPLAVAGQIAGLVGGAAQAPARHRPPRPRGHRRPPADARRGPDHPAQRERWASSATWTRSSRRRATSPRPPASDPSMPTRREPPSSSDRAGRCSVWWRSGSRISPIAASRASTNGPTSSASTAVARLHARWCCWRCPSRAGRSPHAGNISRS